MKTGYKVCDAMTMAPITVKPSASLQEIAHVMTEHHVGAVLVKDAQLRGIITEQDIVRKAVANAHDMTKKKAQDIMEKVIHSIAPEDDIHKALLKMGEANIRHLPVISGKKMVGLLTMKDVLKIQPQLFELLLDKIELREEERKPIASPKEFEGICQLCGEYSEALSNIKSSLVCSDCKDRV